MPYLRRNSTVNYLQIYQETSSIQAAKKLSSKMFSATIPLVLKKMFVFQSIEQLKRILYEDSSSACCSSPPGVSLEVGVSFFRMCERSM